MNATRYIQHANADSRFYSVVPYFGGCLKAVDRPSQSQLVRAAFREPKGDRLACAIARRPPADRAGCGWEGSARQPATTSRSSSLQLQEEGEAISTYGVVMYICASSECPRGHKKYERVSRDDRSYVLLI